MPCRNTTPLPRGWTDATTRRATIPHHHLPVVVMAVAVTIIDRPLLPLTAPLLRLRQATIPTLLLVVAATKEVVIPAMIAMIATTSLRAVLTTIRSLRDRKTRIRPFAAPTRSDHPRVILTFARRSPEA